MSEQKLSSTIACQSMLEQKLSFNIAYQSMLDQEAHRYAQEEERAHLGRARKEVEGVVARGEVDSAIHGLTF